MDVLAWLQKVEKEMLTNTQSETSEERPTKRRRMSWPKVIAFCSCSLTESLSPPPAVPSLRCSGILKFPTRASLKNVMGSLRAGSSAGMPVVNSTSAISLNHGPFTLLLVLKPRERLFSGHDGFGEQRVKLVFFDRVEHEPDRVEVLLKLGPGDEPNTIDGSDVDSRTLELFTTVS